LALWAILSIVSFELVKVRGHLVGHRATRQVRKPRQPRRAVFAEGTHLVAVDGRHDLVEIIEEKKMMHIFIRAGQSQRSPASASYLPTTSKARRWARRMRRWDYFVAAHVGQSRNIGTQPRLTTRSLRICRLCMARPFLVCVQHFGIDSDPFRKVRAIQQTSKGMLRQTKRRPTRLWVGFAR
jgi:hypothetical protein